MDQHRFAALTRSLGGVPSRRDVLRGLVAAGFGIGAARRPADVAGKRKRQPLQLNAFGCVAVGKPCQGRNGLCCSGICEGRKPKPGKKDNSRCVAHDASTCQTGQGDSTACGSASDIPCTSAAGTNGVCTTTTGNAPYCAAAYEVYAYPCQKDADCRPFCGEAAACVFCQGAAHGTACASPTLGSCEFPED